MARSFAQGRDRLLARNRWEVVEEDFKRVVRRQRINQCACGNTGSHKHGRTAEDLRIRLNNGC